MQHRMLSTAMALAIAIPAYATSAAAQGHPHLHTSPRWDECSFQLDASLTQPAWRQFTEEAGLVVYFRSVNDARPMGRGKFEIALMQWETGITATDAAWNDTFVHPDTTHWLFEGSRLKFPGLQGRVGVGAKTDVGVYVTKNPNANYGFYGAQVQRSLASGERWSAAARGSFVSLYGPEDIDFTVYGGEALVSRTFSVTRHIAVSPYAAAATYLASSHEKSAVVALDDERVAGAQGMVGAVTEIYGARLGVEYSVAKVSSLSLKIGFGR